LLRALRNAVAARTGEGRFDGFEAEVSQELAKRNAKSPNGFFMPLDFADPYGEGLEQRTALNLTTGSGAIATITDFSNFIEILRAALVVRGLGARILSGLSGNLSIPRQSAGATAYWVATETTPVTVSNQTIGNVALAPNTLAAHTQLSRKFLVQTGLDAEQFVRQDLAAVLARALDSAAINGSGSGAEPEGILQRAEIPTVTDVRLPAPAPLRPLVEARSRGRHGQTTHPTAGCVNQPEVGKGQAIGSDPPPRSMLYIRLYTAGLGGLAGAAKPVKEVPGTGLEPVTFGSVDRCSIQLS
jgi:hypothetical protein